MEAIIFQTHIQQDTSEDENSREELGLDDGWYATARELRCDPTVALARAILGAPIIKTPWRVQGSNERAVDILKKTLVPLQNTIMRDAVNSGIDYGWQAWETRPQDVDGLKFLRMKQLKHEYTKVYLDKQGLPLGVSNEAPNEAHKIDLFAPNYALTAANEEYGSPIGKPLLKNVENAMARYEEAEEAATMHINKVAGSHWILWYPGTGESKYEGESLPNSKIARLLLDSLKSSGNAALPVTESEMDEILTGSGGGDPKKSGWDLKMVESSSGVDPFLARQQYLDALKMRGLFVPERTALEGQFGTKAESSEHADIAMLAIEQWGQGIMNWINGPYGMVASVLKLNGISWHPGIAQIVPLPLADDDKSFMREMIRTSLNNDKDQIIIQAIDLEKLADRTNTPMLENANTILKEIIDKKRETAERIQQNPRDLIKEEEDEPDDE